MKRSAVVLVLALVTALAPFAPPAHAAALAGVNLPDSLKVGDQDLALNGLGLRTKYFFKVYVGALYLPARNGDAAKILAADEPRRMELHFLRGLSPAQICEGWDEGLAANRPGAGADLKAKFAELCKAMQAVEDGQTLALTYTPADGTKIEFGAIAKGTIAGKEFADALLACWIGDKPGPGQDFKKAVLGAS